MGSEDSMFEITEHPDADTCYAWESPIDDSGKVKIYAVLKLPPIETATDAVHASITKDYKENQSNAST